MNIKVHGVNSQIQRAQEDEIPNEILPVAEPKAEPYEAEAEPSQPKAEAEPNPEPEAEPEPYEEVWDWGGMALSFLVGTFLGSVMQPPKKGYGNF